MDVLVFEDGSGEPILIPADGRRWDRHNMGQPLSLLIHEAEGTRCEVDLCHYRYLYAETRERCFNPTLEETHDVFSVNLYDDVVNGSFTQPRWDYQRGAWNQSRGFQAYFVDVDALVESCTELIPSRKAIFVWIFLSRGEIGRAKQLYGEMYPYELDTPNGHLLQGILHERGEILPHDVRRAYEHYLIAGSVPDVLRLLSNECRSMLSPEHEEGFFCGSAPCREYEMRKLLLEIDSPYIAEKLPAYASDWYDMEHLCDDAHWRECAKYLAYTQREAAKLLLKNGGGATLIQRFLGGYFAYLETGNHDRIFSRAMRNTSSDPYESSWEKVDVFDDEKARQYVALYASRGDALAERALAAING